MGLLERARASKAEEEVRAARAAWDSGHRTHVTIVNSSGAGASERLSTVTEGCVDMGWRLAGTSMSYNFSTERAMFVWVRNE